MTLLFAGTRGEIEARTRRHRRHTVLVVLHRGRRVVVDCGRDWRGRIAQLGPDAIVLTHAHPDHAEGLADGAPCPVHATQKTWDGIARYPIARRHVIVPRRVKRILGVAFEAFPVEHSLRAPAVGYRITAGTRRVFYAPDVLAVSDREAALREIDLYVGDGASLVRPLVRRRGRNRIGHASVRAQIEWCAAEGVPRAAFTHCGTGIVTGDARAIAARVRAWGHARGVIATIARDGLLVRVGSAPALR